MIEHTQTNLSPGNCWQTCIACILDLDPTKMPAQEKYERWDVRPDGTIDHGPGYSNALNAYLRTHHDLCYSELFENVWPAVTVRVPGYHVMLGPTVRSETNGGQHHVVVARYGEMIWDPHPSRAGLLRVERWGILAPFPNRWRQTWERIPCVCPACST